MSNQDGKKEYNIAATPATKVKQYTFGSEVEPGKRDQVKQSRKNRNRRSQSKRNPQNKKQTANQNTGRQTAKADISQSAAKKAGSHQVSKTSGKAQAGKQQTYKLQSKKDISTLPGNVPVKLIETAADVKKDNQRIEKEIILDIKEIGRIEI
ncbi:MAG: hypothetical protein ACOX3H_03295 [Saccharofermentanales bacterium]